MKDIAKQYPLLTAEERFRLFVEAMGRKDEQELDRLENTCPRRNYTMQDYDYTHRKMQFMVLALTSAIQKLRIDLLASTALVVALANDDNSNDSAADKAIEAFKKFMRVRQGKRDGWLRFCEVVGVNPDAITAPYLENIEWAMSIAEGVSETLEEDGGDEPKNAELIATRELDALVDAWGETH